MSHTIAIETSNEGARPQVELSLIGPSACFAGVAIADSNGAHLGTEPLTPQSRHDDDLIPAIDRLTRRLGLAPRDIARVAVSVGPGGYTAVRIAVSAARMLCESLGCLGVAVPSALVAAVHATRALPGVPVAIFLASKRESAYLSLFSPDLQPIGSPTLADPAAARTLLEHHRITAAFADHHLPEAIARTLESIGVKAHPLALSPEACLIAARSMPEVPPDLILPIYAREPEAVRLWESRTEPR